MSIATKAYLIALTVTLLSEAGPVLLGYRRHPLSMPRILAVFVCANLFTHGLIWSVWGSLPGAYATRVVTAELGVWIIEAVLYRWFFGPTWRRAILLSLVANLLSTLLGLWMWRWLYAHGGFELLR